MSSGGEQRGFVFAVTFIVIFSTLLVTIPVGLQGLAEEAEMVIGIEPSLLTGFSETENYSRPAFGAPLYVVYTYDLPDDGGNTWICGAVGGAFSLGAKILWFGLWLGGMRWTNFILSAETNRGEELTFAEIDIDADNGTARYSLQFIDDGNSAGGFVIYWNTTTYSSSSDAWDNDVLYLLHGIGFGATATNNIGALLIGLLFLQIPDVPVLVNVLIVVPIWASIVFVLWYVIKEMIPFV
jgi:predicted secreted protein